MILEPYIGKQKQWSLKTFGPGTRDEALTKHIMKELDEIKQAPGDLEEWIDVIILALEGAFRNGHSADDIAQCLIMKQKKNLSREWPDWRTMDTDQPIEHIKEYTPINQDEFELGGKKYWAKEHDPYAKDACQGCAFDGNNTLCDQAPPCEDEFRHDCLDVIFVEEKS